MDYKKKYNKAQKWIESIYSELSHEQQMEAEAFFPELRESEDERVRKEILSLVRYTKGRRIGYEPRIHQDKMIAWLEQQEGKHITEPQSRWWPSEKQMQMLHRAIEVKAPGGVRDGLESLYNDLKNL